MDNGVDNKWKIFSLVAAGVFMSTLDSSIVNLALPKIMENLNVELRVIQWVVLVYLLTVSALLLPFGRLSDILGRRKIYSAGFLTFGLGSLCCGLAPNAASLIFSRGIQGCGAAMLMACSPALVVDIFPVSERGKALGMVGTIVAMGLTAGPLAGGMILDVVSWRFIFYLNIPIAVISVLAGHRLLRKTPADKGSDEPQDPWGSILLALSIVSAIMAITGLGRPQGPGYQPLFLFIASVIFSFGFAFTESRVRFPVLAPDLLKIKLFTMPILAAAALFAALFVIVFMMPFYLIHARALPPSAAGLILMTPFVMLFFISPFAGILYDKTGSRPLCTLGMILLTAALLLLSRITAEIPMAMVVGMLAMAGTGVAFFISPNSTAIMSSVPPESRGTASGSLATSRNLGMVTGVALAGLIFNTTYAKLSHGGAFKTYSPETASVFMAGFRHAMAAGCFLAVAGLILTLLRGADNPPAPSRS